MIKYIKYSITLLLLLAIVVVNVIWIGKPIKDEFCVGVLSLYILVIYGIGWKYW